jgi:hypothetical protein
MKNNAGMKNKHKSFGKEVRALHATL